MIYPWQQNQWQQLMHMRHINRLPHALLLTGPAGLGKTQFADHITHAYLCERSAQGTLALCAEKPCHACRLLQQHVHPNVLWITPEKDTIKVDQVRNITNFVYQSALQGNSRFVIINPASALNVNAANALLKTLEEPTEDVTLILICAQSARLSATIRSRCQRITFRAPPLVEAEKWLQKYFDQGKSLSTISAALLLKLADGAPLAALALMDNTILQQRENIVAALRDLLLRRSNPIAAFKKTEDIDLKFFLDTITTWLHDVIRLQYGGTTIINDDQYVVLQQAASQTYPQHNINLSLSLQALRAQLASGFNFNKQLLMERIFIQWGESACS